MQAADFAESRDFFSAGESRATRTKMIEIVRSSSTSVNDRFFVVIFHCTSNPGIWESRAFS